MDLARRRPWARFAPTHRVLALIALLGAMNVAIVARHWEAGPVVDEVRMPVIILILAFAFVEWRVIHIQFRAEASSFSLLEIPLVLGLLYATPRDLVMSAVLGMVLGLAFARRQSRVKVAFNAANVGLYAAVAWVIVDAIGPHGELDRGLWLTVFLATAVGSALSVAAILAAITLTEGSPPVRQALRLVAFALAMSAANTALGLLAAMLIPLETFSIALLLIPAAMVLLAFQMFASERAQRERVEFLHQSSRLLEAETTEKGPSALLDAAREMFRAGTAVIVLLPDDETPAAAVISVSDGHTTEQRITTDHEVVAVRRAFDELEEPMMLDPADEGPVADVVRAVGGRDAIVARLATEDRDLGLLVIANRLGSVTSFSDDDLHVLWALAAQSGVLMHNDRLEHALVELQKLERQLAHQATHDMLTGLPNRSLFAQRLDEVAAGTDPFAVYFIDLDDFKVVNDTRGHADGDQLLVAVARRIEALLRPIDIAARLGGDEFAVLVNGHSFPREVADRIVASLTLPFDVGASPLRVGCSVGVARSDVDRDPQRILQHADLAMYQAKRAGKRGVVEFEPGTEGQREIGFKANLREAISAGQLELHYQPIVDLRSRKVCGLEALVRWRSPEWGLLLPGEFIAQAELDGFIIPIDRWVLQQATTDLCRLVECGNDDLFVGVNISARHLQAPDLVEHVTSLTPERDGFGGRLLLEVTETALMGEIERSRSNLDAIRALGVRIALDDFGTGYSSIGYLREFHIDVLKIAGPFVNAAVESQRDLEFVGAMIELGRALGLSIVGEGVEEEAHAETLAGLGCEMAQGFHFARPRPLDDVVAALESDRARPSSVARPLALR